MSGFYTAIVLAAASIYESEQSRKAQNKAARQEKRMAEAQNLRERKQAYRQMLIQQAQIKAAGTNLGVGGSSGVQGGIASLGTSTASNIGFQSQLEALNNKRLSALNSAASHESLSGTYAAASSFSFNAGPVIKEKFTQG